MPSPSLLEGPNGWRLAPEGAAIDLDSKTAVIADVHLGYEWARGRGGDCVPAHSLTETIGQIQCLLARTKIEALVVAGDLVESRRFCRQTLRDVAALKSWLGNQGVTLIALAGNHDPPTHPRSPETLELRGWMIAHGHKKLAGEKNIVGHHHPALQADSIKAPCFLVGSKTIVLPAFSKNAAGTGLEALQAVLPLDDESTRCIATTGAELLDFGPAAALIKALR